MLRKKLLVRGKKVIDQILMLLLLHFWVIVVVRTEIFELFHGFALCREIFDVGIRGSKIASPILFLVRKCPLIIRGANLIPLLLIFHHVH